MNLNEYQAKAMDFALYLEHDNRDKIAIYPFLGLCEEAGEVAGKLAKVYRGDSGLDKESLVKELGDVLWMLSACCTELSVSLDDVAKTNLAKLSDRRERDTLKGEGDDR